MQKGGSREISDHVIYAQDPGAVSWAHLTGSLPSAGIHHQALVLHPRMVKANTTWICPLYTQTMRLQKAAFQPGELLLAPGFCVHLSK